METIEILTTCPKCHQENQFEIKRGVSQSLICVYCSGTILKYSTIKGYIYYLSNPTYPNLLKIGKTDRNVNQRVNELSTPTGVPTPFQIEAYFISEKPDIHEREIHSLLSGKKENKEFYKVDIVTAITVGVAVCKRQPSFISEQTQEVLRQYKVSEEDTNQKQELVQKEKTREEKTQKNPAQEVPKHIYQPVQKAIPIHVQVKKLELPWNEDFDLVEEIIRQANVRREQEEKRFGKGRHELK